MKSKIKDILVQDPFLQFLPEPHKYYDLKRKKYVARSVSEVVKENTYVSKEMEKAGTESYNVNSWAETIYLTKYLGDYDIEKYGDKILITNEGYTVVTKRN